MRFSDAMAFLEDGEKIRRKDWGKNSWISRKECACEGSDCYLYFMRDDNYLIEWELYDDTPKLSFPEVLKGLKEGKKFRRINRKILIVLSQNGQDIAFSASGSQHLMIEDFEALDWEDVLDEWEVYDDTPKLSFQEVIKGLKEGKKFKRSGWDKNHYIQENTGWAIRFWYGEGENDYKPARLWFVEDFEATDWIEVK